MILGYLCPSYLAVTSKWKRFCRFETKNDRTSKSRILNFYVQNSNIFYKMMKKCEFLYSVWFFCFPINSVPNKKLKIPRPKKRTGSIPVSGTKKEEEGTAFLFFFDTTEATGIEQIKCNTPGACCSRGLDRAKP
jgi:hypothetical protein